MPIKIQKNISLSKYTSFKIGGPAKFFCVVENIEEIKKALEFARENKLKIFVLGGGSNLLISDKGIDGFVIKIQNSKFKIKNSIMVCGAGFSLTKLVFEAVKANLTGLEWAAGIPGTVGGAVCNNSGAHGKCIEDVMKEVEVIEIGKLGNKENGNLEIEKLKNKQCGFSYRESVFKRDKKYIILSAVLKLKKGDGIKSRKVIFEYLKSRTEKQPLQYPNAGSVFRNPILTDDHLERLIKENPKLKNISRNNTIPAGWFVEKLRLKGKKIGGATVSEKHGNFIVNTDNAKAEDIVILISIIKQKIRSNFGVQLREEIEYAGF
jgi:UDP-N-acetylmuramate dehydrogenase